jgi:uncharacterized protein (DUF433 family)
MNYRKIITVDPQIRNGEPCVRGLPITVAEIIVLILDGITTDQILKEHTMLTREDIAACAAFTINEPRPKD